MRDAQFQPMLNRMIEKVQKMRPIPPCEDLEASEWGKVDEMLLKTLALMKERGVERPLHSLSEALFDIAARDTEFDKATQAVAYRAMDMRLLADEYGRFRSIVKEVAEGTRDELLFCFPSPLCLRPPSIEERAYREDMPHVVLRTVAGKLRRRGILSGKGKGGS